MYVLGFVEFSSIFVYGNSGEDTNKHIFLHFCNVTEKILKIFKSTVIIDCIPFVVIFLDTSRFRKRRKQQIKHTLQVFVWVSLAESAGCLQQTVGDGRSLRVTGSRCR